MDALGTPLDRVSRRIEETSGSDKSEKVIVAILTDGAGKLKCGILRKSDFCQNLAQARSDDWEFVYLGANQDAIKEGAVLGIKKEYAMSFDALVKG